MFAYLGVERRQTLSLRKQGAESSFCSVDYGTVSSQHGGQL